MDKIKGTTKDLSHVDTPKLKLYSTNNRENNKKAADKAVTEFLDNYNEWKEVVGYIVSGEDGERLYGAALSVFSVNLYFSTLLNEDAVNLLRSEISDYEAKVHYMYEYKNVLYLNLVLCLKKLSLATDDELRGLLKKALFYAMGMSNNTSYQVECYAYRSTNKYLLDAFRDEKLSMSSPTTFNDPFDCPILELLNQYGDDISKLVREAYQDCIKITCFVKNTKVKPEIDAEGNRILIPKHKKDPDEYLNELMWAHYANNHKGVCIKYHFHNDMTKFADTSKNQIAYFRDVKYTSNIDKYRKTGSITLVDAFFVKGKAWEYENELRLLSYDLNGSGKYASVDAKQSIAAVYFGLKCPKRTRTRIINILKRRKWVNEIRRWDDTKKTVVDIKEEHPVEFFQMEIDEKCFGKLKAVKLTV